MTLNKSLPPFMFSTRFSVVPISIENGAGSSRSKRTRVPLAVANEDLGASAAIGLRGVDPGAALVQVSVAAGVPDHQVVAALAEQQIIGVAAGVSVAVEPLVLELIFYLCATARGSSRKTN